MACPDADRLRLPCSKERDLWTIKALPVTIRPLTTNGRVPTARFFGRLLWSSRPWGLSGFLFSGIESNNVGTAANRRANRRWPGRL